MSEELVSLKAEREKLMGLIDEWKAECSKARAERDQLREELARLRRLVPTGSYTLNVAHEEELARMRSLADSAQAKAADYERDWYEAKSEFGSAMAKMRETLRAAEQRELEALAELNEREADIQALRDSRDKWAETARKLSEQLERGVAGPKDKR